MIGMVVGCHGVLVVMMCGYRGVVVVTGLVVMVFRLSQCLVAAVFGCHNVVNVCRFAQFFVSPQLLEGSLDREIEAVDNGELCGAVCMCELCCVWMGIVCEGGCGVWMGVVCEGGCCV